MHDQDNCKESLFSKSSKYSNNSSIKSVPVVKDKIFDKIEDNWALNVLEKVNIKDEDMIIRHDLKDNESGCSTGFFSTIKNLFFSSKKN